MEVLTKEDVAEWLRDALEAAKRDRGLRQEDVAEQLSALSETKWTQTKLSNVVRLDRELKSHEIIALAKILGVPLPGSTARISIVGKVGAGAVVYGLDDGPYGEVENDHGYPEGTVGVEVEGNSMGAVIPDGSLIFYDQTYGRPQEMHIRHNCVVWLADGRVLVKNVRQGSRGDLYSLVSLNDFSIEDDVVIDKIAKVTGIKYR